MNTSTKKTLSVFTLAMLITGSIDSIRNLPASALFGSQLIFFFVLAAITFLLPTALISSQLAAAFPENSGIYQWTKRAMGKHMGFVSIWLQWINTMVWYPTILSFIAGTALYTINPEWVHNPSHLIAVIIIVFWGLTLINLQGLQLSAQFASACAIVGMIIPMILIIVLGIIWLILGNPSDIQLTWHSITPNLSHGASWISLTAIITSFLGMELATVHASQVNNASSVFPKAILIAVIITTLTMLLGSLTIAMIIPANQIELVSGVLQSFALFLDAYHLHWMVPVLAVMLVIGSLGGMINWMISPAKGLLHATQDGYLPHWLTKENKHQVPGNILIVQAVLVTLLCLAFYLMPSINGSYWLLTDLSTEIYVVMYILMFIASLVLSTQLPAQVERIIPGKTAGIWVITLLGLLGCVCALVVGFIPPDGIEVGRHYLMTFSIGMIVMIAPALLIIAGKQGLSKI